MTINKLTVFHLILLPNEPTAQLELESAVTEKGFLALLRDNVDYGAPGLESERLSKGRIFRSSDGALDFDSKAFFDSVISHVNVNYCFHNFDWMYFQKLCLIFNNICNSSPCDIYSSTKSDEMEFLQSLSFWENTFIHEANMMRSFV